MEVFKESYLKHSELRNTKLFDVRVSKKFVTSLSITDHLPPSTAGYLGDLLRAEPDLHEHGALLRHRVPPQVPLSVHRLTSKVSLLNKKTFWLKRRVLFCRRVVAVAWLLSILLALPRNWIQVSQSAFSN